jgi:undecaprenyl-diphosphatase
MDLRVFEFLNGALRGRDWLEDFVTAIGGWSVPLFAGATLSLWLLDRPGSALRWRLVTVSACTAAGLGLLVNQAIGHIWFRERPYAAHPGHTELLASPSADPSFPSDHATAAFAIAFTVLFFSVRVGSILLAAAVAIGVSRILVGLHYPSDVLAGAVIGLACAALVTVAARKPVERVTALASKASDPVVGRLTRHFDKARRSLRRWRRAD